MDFVVGKKLQGFEIKKVETVEDCDATLITMEHVQTKAKLLYLDRKEENKTFSIAFKTIPENDTGVFHILEHSVLNGSRKYPVKEPFVELLKSSMQTFLNAMTYPDKTLFPVSSRNEKDFMNLMDTYLDAVFHPAIYTNPNIFYQEGWHYELDSVEDTPYYKGVVYSEMQGAFSSLDEVILNEANAVLFKDNCYKYESGGDPKKIVTLSYEDFIKTHQKFYHPSNAYIFLDGEMDIEKVLEKINNEYLSEYDYLDVNFDISYQEVLPATRSVRKYEIDENDDDSNRTVLAFGKIVCDYTDVEKLIAYSTLQDLLVGSNKAILNKALLDKKLCEDVELSMIDGIKQPYQLLIVRNTSLDKEEEIKKVIHDEIVKLIENGIDDEMIEASLNQMEFTYREPSEPSGVIYVDNALRSWLYGGDPLLYLNRSKSYENLRNKIHTSYFVDLLKEFFLDEEHLTTFVFEPSKTLAKEREEETQKELEEKKASFTNVQDYVDLCQNLHAWQETKDTKEVLDTLPKLSLEDIRKEAEHLEPVETKVKNVPVLVYPAEKSGVVYMNLYFSIAGVKLEDLTYVQFFVRVLGDLPTEKYDLEELNKRIRRDIGSLSISAKIMPRVDDLTAAVPMIVVSISVLKHKVKEAKELVLEILQHTKFTEEDIKPFLAQGVDSARQMLQAGGHVIGQMLTLSSFSGATHATDYMIGYDAMKWVSNFNDHFDEEIDNVIEKSYLYRDTFFSSSRMYASISGEENIPLIEEYIDSFPTTPFERCIVHYPLREKKDLGIVIPSQVSYVSMSGYMGHEEYVGEMSVLSHILLYEYLWNEIRVKKGAYGTACAIGNTSLVSAYTYRDPSPKTSIETIRNMYTFIDSFVQEHQDLSTYIIGSLASGDSLVTPANKIRNGDRLYFGGITYEYRQNNRNHILETKPRDLEKLKDALKDALKDEAVVVIGPKEAILSCGIAEENIEKL